MQALGEGSRCSTWLLTLVSVATAVLIPGVKARAQSSLPTLTQAAQIRRLTTEQARLKYPVALRGVVTYYAPDFQLTFIQDSSAGIFLNVVDRAPESNPGDVVEVEGVTGPGDFAPQVDHPKIRVVGRAALPVAHRFSLEDLLTGEQDSQWVEVRGVVHSVELQDTTSFDGHKRAQALVLGITSGRDRFQAWILNFSHSANYASLVDAAITVHGACDATVNGKRQLVGIRLLVPGMDQVRIERAGPADPYALPIKSASSLMQFTPERASGHRIRVRGVVTYQFPGVCVFIQDASGGVVVDSTQGSAIELGDFVDAVGFPMAGQYSPVLEDGEFRRIGPGTLPAPVDLTGARSLGADQDAELVETEGQLIDRSVQGNVVVLTIQKQDATFTARLQKELSDRTLASIPMGSRIRMTGIWSIETDSYRKPTAFRILLRSPRDVVVLERPSGWTGRRIAWLLAALAGIVVLSALWVAALRRRVVEQTETIRASLESTGDGIVVVDSTHRITTCNGKFVEMWRIPASVVGSDVMEARLVFIAQQTTAPDAFLRNVRRTDADREIKFDDVIELRDGRIFELHSEPQNVKGKNVGRVWGFRDVTERKRAEKSLEERTAYLNALVEHSPLAIVVLDPDNRVEFCNSAFERLFQYRREEITGSNIDHLIAPADLPVANNEYSQRTTAGQIVHGTDRRRRKDGTLVDVEIYGVPLKVGDRFAGVYGLYQDVTERKRAERELQDAKESAEAANRAKSDFLANMSHEIRTPMNGIIGMTELALDTELTAEQREYLGMVRASADSLLRIINDILDFSKIEVGKLEMDSVDFDLADLMEETVRALALPAHEKGLELICDIAPGVPEAVRGDPTRLRQVVTNLLGNAVKFTERGEVALNVEALSRDEEGVRLHFTVRDTGIGIPKDKLSAIFAPFTQADSSMTRKYGGTGLGLSICAHLVEMMQGKIWVESEPGQGSRFQFTARFGVGEKAATATARDRSGLREVRVLVVDDNDTNRRLLDEVLGRWGMRPTSVESGARALAALSHAAEAGEGFRLVLTDAHMPLMDGFTLAERIRHDPALAEATIMMLTSNGQKGDAARCRELGVAAYLVKPIRQTELREAIGSALKLAPGQDEPWQPVARPAQDEARRGARILVAEDNPVNQAFVVRVLEKRGHRVVVAANGREALAALEKESFDLVLMDGQMPEMDGFEATAAIRDAEKQTGAHIPIVALTASALRGDRERFLQAGMDRYLAKPIRGQDLLEVIETLRIEDSAAARRVNNDSTMRPEFAEALARVDGDVAVLGEIAALFIADYPLQMSAIHEAITRSDAEALMSSAHALKGSVANFVKGPAFEAARRLEMMGRQGDLSGADDAWASLLGAFEQLQPGLLELARAATDAPGLVELAPEASCHHPVGK
ncbi:MAG TPA: response regulator [Terriglobia bacterium]|jgi:PAS domain S-box-containing protein|nr:response regulator [Terriglobia bacterium]